jgi:ATP-dependent RNA helicase UAP56/SUB2
LLLCEALNKSLASNGFEHPSEVQQQCLQHSLAGVDILCQAKAGMGKTAVFVLTILNRIKTDDKECSALIIAHTRELAIQICDEFKRFSGNLEGINTVAVYGGASAEAQQDQINEKKPKIIVGTPGRVVQFIKKGIIKSSNASIFVLDECDKMLKELDMRKDVQFIFKSTPHKKQVIFCSATLPDDIRELCRKFMNKV